MTYLLSIDPGMSTGLVLGNYTATKPYERLGRWQVEGGLKGFLYWWNGHVNHDDGSLYRDWQFPELPIRFGWREEVIVVSEKFSPLPGQRSWKLDELEPIRIEGALEALWGNVVWQPPASMVLAGGDTRAQRKRASDDVLRRLGLWSTGKDVGLKDANDVNSAQKHAIAYLRSIKHKPTLKALEEG